MAINKSTGSQTPGFKRRPTEQGKINVLQSCRISLLGMRGYGLGARCRKWAPRWSTRLSCELA